jgi:hypothetical protein
MTANMSATSMMLPRVQWRLLNIVYGQTALRQTRRAEKLLDWSGADRDDVVALEDLGLVRSTMAPGVLPSGPVQVSLGSPAVTPRVVELSLTPRGMGWCHRNPYNAAVDAACVHGAQSPAPLCRIRAFRRVDPAALVTVAEAGLVRVEPEGRLSVAALRDPNEKWRITVTAQGRYVLGA